MNQSAPPGVDATTLSRTLVIADGRPGESVSNHLPFSKPGNDVGAEAVAVFLKFLGSGVNHPQDALVSLLNVSVGYLSPKCDAWCVSFSNGAIAFAASRDGVNISSACLAAPCSRQKVVEGIPELPTVDTYLGRILEFLCVHDFQVLDFCAEFCAAVWNEICKVGECLIVVIHPQLCDFILVLKGSALKRAAGNIHTNDNKTKCGIIPEGAPGHPVWSWATFSSPLAPFVCVLALCPKFAPLCGVVCCGPGLTFQCPEQGSLALRWAPLRLPRFSDRLVLRSSDYRIPVDSQIDTLSDCPALRLGCLRLSGRQNTAWFSDWHRSDCPSIPIPKHSDSPFAAPSTLFLSKRCVNAGNKPHPSKYKGRRLEMTSIRKTLFIYVLII